MRKTCEGAGEYVTDIDTDKLNDYFRVVREEDVPDGLAWLSPGVVFDREGRFAVDVVGGYRLFRVAGGYVDAGAEVDVDAQLSGPYLGVRVSF